jgi:hypothetical protein
MQVAWRGARSIGQTLTVADSAPGIFTADSSGSGQGAIFSEDLGANSASNPAARGSIVTLFATGAGQTAPAGVDGQVSSGALARPLLPVRVEIGGQDATVVDAAAAPGFIAGVLQVKVRIPETVAPGPGVPVTLIVGTARSSDTVTAAIAPAGGSLVPNPAAVRSIAPTAVPGDPSHGYPFFATTVDLKSYSYIEEEFLFEGTANRYNTPALATGSVTDSGHTYRTRMIVRRPVAPGKFNGTVLMEWQNVAAGYDLDALWAAQIFPTGCFCRKARLKFGQISRVILHGRHTTSWGYLSQVDTPSRLNNSVRCAGLLSADTKWYVSLDVEIFSWGTPACPKRSMMWASTPQVMGLMKPSGGGGI